jgi:hypothetical protein
MNNSFLKIEIIDSKPVVTFEYKDLEEFKDIMFFILSDSGLNLLYNSIEQDLILNNKDKELDILTMIIDTLNVDNADSDPSDEDDFITPFSFA